jgi:excisionase family DNA binding protein
MEPLDPLMTTEDVANYLKLDVVTVRRIVSRGDLAAYRIGGEYRFMRGDILDFLKRQHIPARPQGDAEREKTLRQAFKILTKRAKRAIWELAADEARDFKQPQIGTEHLLLGLLRESEGVAGRVLADLGVKLDEARRAVEVLGGIGEGPESIPQALSPTATDVIEIAFDQAIRLNHHFIGTEHLLLGLLREGEGNAVRVLERLSVSPEHVRVQVMAKFQPRSAS